MDYGKYKTIVSFMEECMKGNKNSCLHTHRVVNYALQILETEPSATAEVVIIAALLHDIGCHEKRSGNKGKAYHAKVGSEKSYTFLIENGYTEDIARHIADCILTHSLNSALSPETLEAKIVFDADKLDLTGAVGTFRAILSSTLAGEPLYLLDEEGIPLSGRKKEGPSLLQNYQQQLKKLPRLLHTAKAQKIATKQQKTMDCYFKELKREIAKNHKNGSRVVAQYCREE